MGKIKIGLNWHQSIIGVILVFAWIFLFTSGLIINSEPYRNIISGQGEPNGTSIFFAWLVVVFCYTPTNIIFLTIISGMLGSISRIAILHVQDKEHELPSDKTNPIISGALRGIFVYLLVISGVLVINEAPFITPTPIQYARLSGFMSLISFMMSYNPVQFKSFLKSGIEKVENKITNQK